MRAGAVLSYGVRGCTRAAAQLILSSADDEKILFRFQRSILIIAIPYSR